MAGKFPPQYMGIVFGGQAFGGIFASVTNVVVILFGVKPSDAAFFCFLIAVVFLATVLLSFIVVTRSGFFQFYLDEKKPADVEFKSKKVVPWFVFKTISVYAVSIFLIFTVTLACFPAITVLVTSSTLPKDGAYDPQDYEWGTKYFIPVCCFVLFNVGDWLGCFAAKLIQWPKPGRFGMFFILFLVILRLAFIPLFLLCNANPLGRNLTSVYFYHDAFYIGFMALFSLSNGYLSSICMMSAPQLVKGSEAQTAAGMMVALLGLGLGAGSLMSFSVKSLL